MRVINVGNEIGRRFNSVGLLSRENNLIKLTGRSADGRRVHVVVRATTYARVRSRPLTFCDSSEL